MIHEICGLENLHVHSDYSLLDGTGTVFEYAARAPKINQKFLCITDHGMMGAIPQQIKACEEHGISPIFGVELYVHPNQPEITPEFSMSNFMSGLCDDERKKMRKSYHITAIAYNNIGYENLVQLTSWAWLHGFYYKPRVNHQQLMKYKEGITFCSGCYNGEIGQAFENGGEDAAMAMIEKYLAMFGQHFYLEFMLLDFHKQKPYDIFLQKAHAKYGIPMVCTNDCHYCNQEDSLIQRNMLMVQTNKTIHDLEKAKLENVEMFELQDQNLWMKSEEELNEFWAAKYTDAIDLDVFKQAKRNTVIICEQAKGVELDRSVKLPKLENENEILWDEAMRGFKRRGLPRTKEYADRLREEYNLIKDKEFASYFLIEKMMTDEARRAAPEILGFGDGSEAVGPGRGSAAGSLLCYCLGITDVNPIPHGLLFSRFLSPARGGKSLKVRFTQKAIGAVAIEEEQEEMEVTSTRVEFKSEDIKNVLGIANERHKKRSGGSGLLDTNNADDTAIGILAELACERLGLGKMDQINYDSIDPNQVRHDLIQDDGSRAHVKAKRPTQPGWLIKKATDTPHYRTTVGEKVYFCNADMSDEGGFVDVLGYAYTEELVPFIKLPYVPHLQVNNDGLWKSQIKHLFKPIDDAPF